MKSSRVARYGGFLLGGAVAGALLWSGAMPANPLANSELPAHVTMVSEGADLLAVEPAGDFISREPVGRSPRREALGTFTVRNPSGAKVGLSIAASAAADVVPFLQVSVQAGSRTVYSGGLAQLRQGTERFTIAKGGRIDVTVRAWVPASSSDDYQARAVQVPLQLQAKKLAG